MATLVVNSTDDIFNPAPGVVTLRSAIEAANNDSSSDPVIIELQPGVTYNLTLTNGTHENSNLSGDLDIRRTTGSVLIRGGGSSGADQTIISAAGLQTASTTDRVLQLLGNTDVTLEGLTITGGVARTNVNAGANTSPTGQSSPGLGGGILQAGGLLTLDDVSVVGNEARSSIPQVARGGGLYADSGSATTILNSRFADNVAQGGNNGNASFLGSQGGGGAIFINGGTLVLTSSLLSGNRAQGGDGADGGSNGGGQGGSGYGGGMAVFNSPSFSVNSSTFEGNEAIGGKGGAGLTLGGTGGLSIGGAAYLENSTGAFAQSAIHDNESRSGNGGSGAGTQGFSHNGGNSGPATGGGIELFLSTVQFTLTTIADNRAAGGDGGNGGLIGGTQGSHGSGGLASGGGIKTTSSAVTLTHVTISANRAVGGNAGVDAGGADASDGNPGVGRGGGVYNSSSSFTGRNSIIAGNIAANGAGSTAEPQAPDIYDSFGSGGHNLIGNESGASITRGIGDKIGDNSAPIDPKLAPLADNGGPTKTMALLAGSPAIDEGVGLGSVTDQRGAGFLRTVNLPSYNNSPSGDGTDIGAFELQQDYLPDLVATKSNDSGGQINLGETFRYTITWTNQGVGKAIIPQGTVLLVDDLQGSVGQYQFYGAGAISSTGTGSISSSVVGGTLQLETTSNAVFDPGEGFTIYFDVTPTTTADFMNPRAGGSAIVDPNGAVTENDETNNAFADPETVSVTAPDLILTKTNDANGSLVVGDTWTWTVTVTNQGTGDAVFHDSEIILTDALPSTGLTLLQSTFSTTGSGQTHPNISADYIFAARAVGDFVLETGETITVTFRFRADAGGTYTNPRADGLAIVDPDGVVPESDNLNNSGSDTVVVSSFDFGDAPNTYGTLLASDGARHVTGSGPRLGASVDAEADGQASANAQGDDANGDDEDGVTLPATGLIAGLQGTAQVAVVGSGILDAWIDFNGNGVFEATEKIAAGLAVAGNTTLSFTTPADAVAGATFARFRVSTLGSVLPTGVAADGEVEDHAIQISAPAPGSAGVFPDPSNPGKFLLLVNGTSLKDKIYVYPYSSTKTRVELNGKVIATVTTAAYSRIVVFGREENDLVTINPAMGKPSELHGNEGNDTLKGSNANDVLFGENGNDSLYGLAGNDTQYGGDGIDRLWGDAGNDVQFGGGDGDTIYGGVGNDQASGDAGNDTLFGEAGNDSLVGGQGDDSANGGAGMDTLRGGLGNDRLNGGLDNDILLGEGDNDVISGEAGRDFVFGGSGNDILNGNEHEDLLVGGTTLYDGADSALASLLAEWSANRPYATRVNNMKNGGGLLAGSGLVLRPGVTTFDDGAADTFKGHLALDWFITGSGDSILDLGTGEQQN